MGQWRGGSLTTQNFITHNRADERNEYRVLSSSKGEPD